MPIQDIVQIDNEPGEFLQMFESNGGSAPRVDAGFQTSLARLNRAVSRSADAEEVHLKEMLSVQESARKRAQASVAELNRKLKSVELESTRVRNELRRAHADLEVAKRDFSFEVQRAAGRESGLWSELAAVRRQATIALEDAARFWKRWVAGSMVLATLALCGAFEIYRHAPAGHLDASVDSAADSTSDSTAKSKAVRPARNSPAAGAAKTAPNDLVSSLDRLDDALGRFRYQKPEEVLRSIHALNASRGVSVCAFDWTAGRVSLLFGSQAGTELGAAVEKCADAVEKVAE